MNIESRVDVTETGTSAVELLAADTGLPKSRIKDAMTKGAVWLTHKGRTRRLRRATARQTAGDVIEIFYDPEILAAEVPAPELIADYRDYSVWYKPAGLLSSGSRYGDHCAINRWVERQLDRPVFIVHRLDRFTRGLIVLAHSKRAAAALSAAFKERRVNKRYKALVRGEVTEILELDATIDGKPARSVATPLDCSDGYTLLDVEIETGRKHQIRRHLAGAGYPVIGDRQYGQDASMPLQLVAWHLALDDPASGERRVFDLPPALHLVMPVPDGG